MRLRIVALLATLVYLASPAIVRAAEPEPPAAPAATGLKLLERLPRDPVFAAAYRLEDPAAAWDAALAAVSTLAPEAERAKIDEALAKFDEQLGLSLRNDLLGALGGEIALVVDLPPLDQFVVNLSGGSPEGMKASLGAVGVVMDVVDGSKVDASLRKLAAGAGGTLTESDGIVEVTFAPSDGTGEGTQGGEEEDAAPAPAPALGTSSLAVYWGVGESVLALGFAREWVRSALDGAPEGQRMSDGEDYARVFSHLASDPVGMSYFNLPRVDTMVRSSGLLGMAMASEPEAKAVFDWLLDNLSLEIGYGTTTSRADGGTLQMAYGPGWLSSPTFAAGIVAAVAIPNFVNAIDRGKQKRTMADIRSVATAAEAFGVDNARYPGPTDGWVPVSSLSEELSPVYIRDLPVADGWGHELLYWSDGSAYALVSPGKDGVLERDWSGEVEPDTTSHFEADVVFRDGQFVRWPEGTQH